MAANGGQEYPCPCCGWLVFGEAPGSYDICPICFWEDDLVQLRWPDLGGGANGPSLIGAQANFFEYAAKEERFVRHVRAPAQQEQRDPEWRPFDREVDTIEGRVPGKDYGMTYANDTTVYYYRRSHPSD
jgi:hypothetical protein